MNLLCSLTCIHKYKYEQFSGSLTSYRFKSSTESVHDRHQTSLVDLTKHCNPMPDRRKISLVITQQFKMTYNASTFTCTCISKTAFHICKTVVKFSYFAFKNTLICIHLFARPDALPVVQLTQMYILTSVLQYDLLQF